MKLVNVTRHPISLANEAGEVIETIAPSGAVALIEMTPGIAAKVPGVAVPVQGPPTIGQIVGLPAPAEGVLYIASLLVAQAAGRSDVVQPGTGPRDNPVRVEGRVVAVRRLVRHH